MLTACYLLNRVQIKRNKTTPYEVWYKKRANLSFLRVWGCRAVVRLRDPKRKTLNEKSIDCIFVGYAEHSKAYRFYIIEPNDSVSINSVIEFRDAIFDESRFSSIHRPKDIIPNSVESQRDDHYDEMGILKPMMKLCNLGMLLFRKKAIDDEIGSIIENNTWVLSDLPPGCKPLGFRQKKGIDYFDTYAPIARITTIILLLALAAIHNLVIHHMDVKAAFLNGDLDEEIFSMKDMGEAAVIIDCSPVSTLMDPVEKLKPNTSKPVDHLEYSRAIGYLMYGMTSTRPNIAYTVGRLSRFTKAYLDASWINHVEDSSSTSGWVFLLGGCAISWASKKQACITSSTIEAEFVALAAAGKKSEWLRNLIREIPI
nr:hypothetical protein [Tanacetum cinerariifolium]